ncbi:hypothetical protein [Stenotrophomonas maltophilia]|uniref:hypothetical protein n=1 Tax=Stenotrophomonas maltophilia TaxID=40324 RepID=UPI003D7E2E7A
MEQQTIDIDTVQPNGKKGDPARTMAQKINTNFGELMAPKSPNLVLGGPPSGTVDGQPSYRALVMKDLPDGIRAVGEAGNQRLFWATPTSGNGLPSMRSITVADLPDTVARTDVGQDWNSTPRFGFIQSTGIRSRNNIAYGPNYITFEWTSGMRMWVDGMNVGTISTVSDPRIKHLWETVGPGDLADVLSVVPKTWRYRDIALWSDDGIRRRSFNSNELEDVDPTLVTGDRNSVNQLNGTPQPQNIDPLAVCSKLWGALREEAAARMALEDRLSNLEAASLGGSST